MTRRSSNTSSRQAYFLRDGNSLTAVRTSTPAKMDSSANYSRLSAQSTESKEEPLSLWTLTN